jgi:hypothetical protein
MTSHEILGFMSAQLSSQLLDDLFTDEKPLYKAALAAAANARKVRPQFLEKMPRAERHPMIVATLSRQSMEDAAGNLLRGWLLLRHKPLLCDFLGGLGIDHKDGVVDDLPKTVEDAKLKSTVEALLGKYPQEVVAVYLWAFNHMNDVDWANLDALLKDDVRLHLGG